MSYTDVIYQDLVKSVFNKGEKVPTRNGMVRRLFTLPTVEFNKTPLVTIRKTAWSKAIREMEWFLSGNPKCPAELLDWWKGQLSPDGYYLGGYGCQLRTFCFTFDQIEYLLEGLSKHPYSRRHVLTTWNPAEMSYITELNENPRTPTNCHSTVVQFFCSTDGGISLHSYQRSADMLLGVPHNWIQSWALLLWIANQTDRVVEKMLWTFGDAHIYLEESHTETASRILDSDPITTSSPRLEYRGDSDFKTTDFYMVGSIPPPVVITRPKLL